jgi:tetratricopeptide (TPR) repeat protein
MHIACLPSVRLLVVIFVVLSAITADADKSNKFYFNVERYYGNGVVYFDRACRELDRGNLQGALQSLDAAIQADPKMWPAWFARAQVNLELKKYDLALRDCNAAGQIKPQFKRTFIIRAEALARMNRCTEALADLDRVISLHPYEEIAAFALTTRAWVHAGCRNSSVYDPKKAVEDATQACKLDGWKMADYLDTLAYACAVNGDFESAIRYEKKAIDSGRFAPDELKRAEEHLAYYQSHSKH